MRYKKRLPFLPVPHVYNSRLTKREGKHNLSADEMILFKSSRETMTLLQLKLRHPRVKKSYDERNSKLFAFELKYMLLEVVTYTF